MKNSIKRRIKELKKEIQKLEIIRPGKITKQIRGLKEERFHYDRTEYIKSFAPLKQERGP